ITIAVSAVWFAAKLETGTKPAAAPQAMTTPAPRAAPPSDNTDTIVDFSKIDTGGKTVAARPYLKDYGISVTDLAPPNSNMIIANNLAIYGGAAIRPTVSQNFLMQVDSGESTTSYTLRFDKPVDAVKFIRPQLFRDTESGVTHPAWTATALDAN